MAAPNIKDFATSLVVTAPSPADSGTSLVVTTGEGARFPVVPFDAVLHPASELPTLDNAEQVLVTNVSGDTLTIDRAENSTSAQDVAVGWRISNAVLTSHVAGAYSRSNHTGTQTASTISDFTSAVTTVLESEDMFKNYQENDQDDVEPITYTGYCRPDGEVWLIKKVEEIADNDYEVTYANVSNNPTKTTYALAWTDRATLTYEPIGALTI